MILLLRKHYGNRFVVMTHKIIPLEVHHTDDVWRIEQAANTFPWRSEERRVGKEC